MPQPSLHPVPDHRSTHRPTDHESHFGAQVQLHRGARCRWALVGAGTGQMHDHGATGSPTAPLHPRREVVAAGQSDGSGQQREISGGKGQADNSMRPLRRRAARIARPARVRMRNRNPWVLARRRLFGWNVRLPLLTAVVLPVLWCASPWARARKNARRWAGDGPSLGGRHPRRQNRRLASLSGRHAVTSMVLAYTGFLWQHSRLVSLRRPNTGDRPASWHVGDPGRAAITVIHSCG